MRQQIANKKLEMNYELLPVLTPRPPLPAERGSCAKGAGCGNEDVSTPYLKKILRPTAPLSFRRGVGGEDELARQQITNKKSKIRNQKLEKCACRHSYLILHTSSRHSERSVAKSRNLLRYTAVLPKRFALGSRFLHAPARPSRAWSK